MTDAYVETTVLTDILLKPNTLKQQRAKAALARFKNTLLPVYSIKEWKAGPLGRFAYVHNKLVQTKSLGDTLMAISALAKGSYYQTTSNEALAAAGQLSKKQPRIYLGLGSSDRDMADSYRLALESLVFRSWRKRRKITTKVVDELPCYVEAAPQIEKNGLLELKPQKCQGDEECCLAPKLKSELQLLQSLRDSIPEGSGKAEHQRRRKALKQLIKHPNERVDRDTCRQLGDAIFAFFCPIDAVILTTNLRDLAPLAAAIGKTAISPAVILKS